MARKLKYWKQFSDDISTGNGILCEIILAIFSKDESTKSAQLTEIASPLESLEEEVTKADDAISNNENPFIRIAEMTDEIINRNKELSDLVDKYKRTKKLEKRELVIKGWLAGFDFAGCLDLTL